MKIDEAIEMLTRLRLEHGNAPVVFECPTCRKEFPLDRPAVGTIGFIKQDSEKA